MSWSQEPKTDLEHANNLDALAGIFQAMIAHTHIEGPDLPITGHAENFIKYMLKGSLESCQYAANELRARGD